MKKGIFRTWHDYRDAGFEALRINRLMTDCNAGYVSNAVAGAARQGTYGKAKISGAFLRPKNPSKKTSKN